MTIQQPEILVSCCLPHVKKLYVGIDWYVERKYAEVYHVRGVLPLQVNGKADPSGIYTSGNMAFCTGF
jgi:hypothetical protein